MTKTIKVPSPDHPIAITPIAVKVSGRFIADTWEALSLKEASHPPIQYIPRENVDMSLMVRTDRVSYCPGKGDCAYYGIAAGGERSINAIWTRAEAYPVVAALKRQLAFYPDRIGAIKVRA